MHADLDHKPFRVRFDFGAELRIVMVESCHRWDFLNRNPDQANRKVVPQQPPARLRRFDGTFPVLQE
jgi:hypothetical protein